MGRRRRHPKVHDAHSSAATTSRAPWRSRRSGLSSGPQARSSLKPLRPRWSTTTTLPLLFRRTIPTTTRISLCLLFVLQDLGFFFFFFFFWLCTFWGIWFVFLWNFFFSSSTCACVWLLKKCGKEMGIWILVGVLKNLLSMAMFSIY